MKKLLVFSCLVALFAPASAQISLVFPMERQVFQRDNSDHAFIQITGNFTAEYDSIQAQVTVRAGTTKGANTGWKTINYRNSTKPYFYGKLQAEGGWYTLDVRAFKNGVAIDTVSRSRVGIGEVFVIAGQSNASGGKSYGIEATEDRVNCINFDANQTEDYNRLTIGFSKLTHIGTSSDSVSIAPFQYVPWHWGKLGDILSSQYDVPILFLGAAYGGTAVSMWANSADKIYPHPVYNSWMNASNGHPYRPLEMSLTFYCSLTGVRAVLWHQGESEYSRGTSGSFYKSELLRVVNESREDAEHTNLAWVVARATYAGYGLNPPINNAQAEFSQENSNVFLGPNTDQFVGPTYRTDGTHLDTFDGLMAHATEWSYYLDSSFIANSTPKLAEDFIELSLVCNLNSPSSPIELQSIGSYDLYAWSNRDNLNSEAIGYATDGNFTWGSYPPPGYERLNWTYDSTNLITAPTGRYALNVRKAGSGKALFSPILDLNTFNLPTTPGATASAAQIRPGDSVTLTGNNCNATYVWNTNSQSNPLVVSPASTSSYAVACKTLHCLSVSSAPVEVVVSSCFSTPLTLSGAVGSAQAPYQSKQTIKSTQMVNSPGGDIDYTAAKSILLSPGFQAQNGTGFQATIQDCN